MFFDRSNECWVSATAAAERKQQRHPRNPRLRQHVMYHKHLYSFFLPSEHCSLTSTSNPPRKESLLPRPSFRPVHNHQSTPNNARVSLAFCLVQFICHRSHLKKPAILVGRLRNGSSPFFIDHLGPLQKHLHLFLEHLLHRLTPTSSVRHEATDLETEAYRYILSSRALLA